MKNIHNTIQVFEIQILNVVHARAGRRFMHGLSLSRALAPILILIPLLMMTGHNANAQAGDEKPSGQDNQAISSSTPQLDRPSAEEATGNPDLWRWKYRPLIIFTDNEAAEAGEKDHPARLQTERVLAQREGFVERDMIFVVIRAGEGQSTLQGEPISQDTAEIIRQRFFADSQTFEVILVGKDGGAKLRRSEPVKLEEVFQLIDGMPMRQREMRE